MKPSQFYILCLIGFASLVLTTLLAAMDRTNLDMQQTIQEQQKALAQAAQSQQIFENIVRDLAPLAAKDEKIRELLVQNGFTISVAPPGSQP